MHNSNIFGARTNHEHTRTQKTHHSLILGETTTLPFYNIVLWLVTRVAPKCHFSWESQVENPKIPNIGIPAILDAYNFLYRPPIEVRSKAKL
jgi:hypothetical protein